jgi:1-acyl-sn-glycerol-3-phosphate acyltransferase
MDIWYNFVKNSLRVYLALFMNKIYVRGLENITNGPKIVVANHSNASDAFVLPFIFKEKLHFAIQAEAFSLPVIGRLLTLADQIPVSFGQGRAALRAAGERLMRGNSVVIFPEGRLNHGGEFRRAGAGAAMLAIETGMPVIPVGFYSPPEFVRKMRGHFYNRETFGGWQFGGKCYVHIGAPLRLLAESGAERGYRSLRKMTDQVMDTVLTLVQHATQEARLNLQIQGPGLETGSFPPSSGEP